MNPQMKHALLQVVIGMAVAALAALAQHLSDIPIDPQYSWVLLIIGAAIPGIIRALEGAQDAGRALANKVLPRDVGYNELMAATHQPERVKL